MNRELPPPCSVTRLGSTLCSPEMTTLSSSAAIAKSEKPRTFEDYKRAPRLEDPGFHARLLARCATFSHREMEIIVLIRLGYDSTEAISKVLPVSMEAIDNICCRIRKKLGLKHGEKLYQAIQAI